MSVWLMKTRATLASSKLRSGLLALALVAIAACGGTDGNEDNNGGGGTSGSAGAGSPDGGSGHAGGGASGASGGPSGTGGGDASAMGGSAGTGGSSGAGVGGTSVPDGGAPEVDTGGPRCGNGIKEGTEECDDGNSLDQDGCSSTCLLSECCEKCEQDNCPVDNSRDPVSDLLVSQPTCAAFANDKAPGGKLKRELCAAVQACIVRTGCALDAPTGPLGCYCGSGVDSIQCKAGTPNGPCKQEIEAGFATATPDYVIGNYFVVSEPSGAALNRAICHWNFCTTPAAGGARTPRECYRAAGTPIPMCDLPPEAGVDAAIDTTVSLDASVDTGTNAPDVGVDTGASTPDVVDTGSPLDAQSGGDSGSGICPSAQHESTTCAMCESLNCPNDPAGCSNGTCVSQPACSDFSTLAQRDACTAVLNCVRSTNCNSRGPLSCYCGTADSTQCNSTTPPNANGLCKSVIEAAFGSASPSFIRGNLLVVSYPGGGALNLAQCDYDFCGNDVMMDSLLHACVPYCK